MMPNIVQINHLLLKLLTYLINQFLFIQSLLLYLFHVNFTLNNSGWQ